MAINVRNDVTGTFTFSLNWWIVFGHPRGLSAYGTIVHTSQSAATAAR